MTLTPEDALLLTFKKSSPDLMVCYSCNLSRPWNDLTQTQSEFHLIDYRNIDDEGILEEWQRMYCEDCNGKRLTKNL